MNLTKLGTTDLFFFSGSVVTSEIAGQFAGNSYLSPAAKACVGTTLHFLHDLVLGYMECHNPSDRSDVAAQRYLRGITDVLDVMPTSDTYRLPRAECFGLAMV